MMEATVQTPNTNAIRISGGEFIRPDGDTPEEIVGDSVVAPFTPQGDGLERWDMVALDLAAEPAGFVIIVGKPQAIGGGFFTSVANVPSNHYPMVAVKIDEPAEVIVRSEDLVDLRSKFNEVDPKVEEDIR